MKTILLILISLMSSGSFAKSVANGFTEKQMAEMAEANNALAEFQKSSSGLFSNPLNPLSFGFVSDTTVRPVGEYEKAGYLLFNSDLNYNSFAAKQGMAQNLPKDVTLVVYTQYNSSSHIEKIRQQYSQWLPDDRLKVVYLPGAGKGFWARDSVPVPVIRTDNNFNEMFTVVDARYYHGFEADQEISDLFAAEMTRHNFFYEGGNFMASSRGDCIVVNTQATQQVPNSVFTNHYGCSRLKRLPHVKGIGHIDESVKFINDNTVVTDTPSYVQPLQEMGFQVVMLPRPARAYETYVNALIVNGTVFVPVFAQNTDQQALNVFSDLGLKVVPLPSTTLSNQGLGSIHCITMTYPPVPFQQLIETLDAESLY